jgi:hypothetical protein
VVSTRQQRRSHLHRIELGPIKQTNSTYHLVLSIILRDTSNMAVCIQYHGVCRPLPIGWTWTNSVAPPTETKQLANSNSCHQQVLIFSHKPPELAWYLLPRYLLDSSSHTELFGEPIQKLLLFFLFTPTFTSFVVVAESSDGGGTMREGCMVPIKISGLAWHLATSLQRHGPKTAPCGRDD